MMFAPVSLLVLLLALSSSRAALGFVPQSAPAAPAVRSTTALCSSFDDEPRPRRRSPFYKTAGGSQERRSPFSSVTSSPSPSGYASSYSTTSGASSSASIPFMITQKMKRALIEDLRYSRRDVENMSAETATSILAGGIASSRTVPCSYNQRQQGADLATATEGASDGEQYDDQYQGDSSQWQYEEESPPPPFEDPLVEMEEQFGDHHRLPQQQQQHWEPSQEQQHWADSSSQEQQYQYEQQYQESPTATDPLTEMEEQFGDVTEEVLRDDRYGPSVFSSQQKGRFSSLSKGPSSSAAYNRRDQKGGARDQSPWVTRDPY